MLRYIFRRLIACIPTIWLVVTLVFFAFELIPGDAAAIYAGEQASAQQIERVRHEMGLDKPVLVRYGIYLNRIIHGDLGRSALSGMDVSSEIMVRFEKTVQLSLLSIAFASVLGITFGTVSAFKRNTWVDYFLTLISVLGISLPNFWFGILLIYTFAIKLHWLPATGSSSTKNYILPVICSSFYSIAFITRITRSALLEVLGEDYVRTARAKGLSEKAVVSKHVLRNGLIPVITTVGLQFGYMLGGSVVTETVFAWPGMGRLLVSSVEKRDITMVQGVLLVVAACFLIVNLCVDLIYCIVDPRIRYS